MIKEVTVNKSLKDILDKESSLNNDNIKIVNSDDQPQNIDEPINEWKNKYLYLQADLENIKKRYNKQISDLRKYEGENIFKDIITDVCDDFDYLLRYNKSNTLDRSNIEVIYRRLLNVLNKYGVKQMYGFDHGNRPMIFNSDTDDAVSQITTNDKILDNSINDVIKKGYNFKDKVLRYEQVIVNKYKENHDKIL